MATNNFKKDLNAGKEWANKVSNKVLNKYNDKAFEQLFRSSATCIDYASKGRKGNKKLSQSEIDFYAGAFCGFFDICQKK